MSECYCKRSTSCLISKNLPFFHQTSLPLPFSHTHAYTHGSREILTSRICFVFLYTLFFPSFCLHLPSFSFFLSPFLISAGLLLSVGRAYEAGGKDKKKERGSCKTGGTKEKKREDLMPLPVLIGVHKNTHIISLCVHLNGAKQMTC